MVPDWLLDWFDNPLFMKHVRSRLRRPAIVSGSIVTLAICLCIAWAGYEFNQFVSGGTYGALLVLQAILLCIMGASQVGTAVSSARASGILEFHRVSPLTPTELALGYFFGAPVREYLLFLVTIPLAILCVAAGTPDLRGFLQVMIVLIASSWVLQSVALVNGLITKRPTGGRGIIGLIIFLGWIGGGIFPAFGNVANLLDREPRLGFFGISLPWLPVVLLYQAPIILFAFLAARRKLESERLHALSKPQAMAAMGVAGLLAVGGTWGLTDNEFVTFLILYALVGLGILLTIIVTPKQAEYYKGLLRAMRKGEERPSWWADHSMNRPFLAVVGAIVLGASTIVWHRSFSDGSAASSVARKGMPLSIAVGTLVVVYFGLALQYFLARFGRGGTTYLTLFLFLAWLIPLVLGTIIIVADFRRTSSAQVVYALGPIAGIGLASGAATSGFNSTAENFPWVAAAAITPTLLFTFVFNMLVSSAKKRFRRVVSDASRWTPESGQTDRPAFLEHWESDDRPSAPTPGEVPTSGASS
ncbi:ABC-2 family transporter protein [Aquisphaera giovannonii]|uniref:ABC-2 family transporter protein n=1 Tax=Aquisphaera giovannonii TaxID=406548 RepID=A0A5B9VZV1_9BACT|nr:ABC transporter permease [Aquisphaera giovannonii]QEH33529.1 ABC-2 family transporter protein [Aquisphaera giovannonii]